MEILTMEWEKIHHSNCKFVSMYWCWIKFYVSIQLFVSLIFDWKFFENSFYFRFVLEENINSTGISFFAIFDGHGGVSSDSDITSTTNSKKGIFLFQGIRCWLCKRLSRPKSVKQDHRCIEHTERSCDAFEISGWLSWWWQRKYYKSIEVGIYVDTTKAQFP